MILLSFPFGSRPSISNNLLPAQTLKASKALLSHIQNAAKEQSEVSTKKNLLDDDDDAAETPVWMTLTTKRHISDKARLQPGKIALPHPLLTTETEQLSICLITADPQRAYKTIVDAESFPADLRSKIGRVIDVTKLKAKFSQYEAQRKLYAEHDVFLGDDRIINRLPKILGKTFYKSTAKRPIPVILQTKATKVDGKRKRTKTAGEVNAASPEKIAREITKALSSALVSLAPTTNTAIRIGYANWTAEQIAENVDAVATALVEKWVPQKWNNVKSIHIKGNETVALPIWMTDELWVDDKDVVANDNTKATTTGKKRKSTGAAEPAAESPAPKKAKKAAAAPKPNTDDAQLDKQISDRKANLRKQKATARKAMDA